MVGIVAAQSIGEPTTQLALNSFHFSGVGSRGVITNTGVPRINEIINMSKDIKTPSMMIYLKKQYAQNKDVVMEVKNTLEYTEIKDILSHSEIMYLPDVKEGKYEEETFIYEAYEEMMSLMEIECPDSDSLSHWVLWMEFDREAMLQKGIYMQDIHEEIIKNCNVDTDIQCVIADMNSAHLTLRIRVRQNFEEGEDYIVFFRSLGDCLLTLPLRGVPGIRDAFPREISMVHYDENGSPELIKEWVLNTDGSNLIEVLCNDYVDHERTTTNDIAEIYNIFGIEGARYAIIREIETTISAGGASEIDYRHFSVLSDLMTYRGFVMQIQRHGFGKSPYIGPLGRATYEVMDKVLVTSSIFAEKDNMKGTSANIIMGQSVRSGTNAFDLLVNPEILPEHEEFVFSSENQEISISKNKNESDVEFTENKNFESVMNKVNSSQEVNLEDYMRDIENFPIQIEDSDFTFGYDIENTEEQTLPSATFDKIKLNIVKSTKTTNNRRRRKK
jgi:DNA-directed RNA polymerase II subunit RPB1